MKRTGQGEVTNDKRQREFSGKNQKLKKKKTLNLCGIAKLKTKKVL